MEMSYKVVPFRTDGYETRYCVVSAETPDDKFDAKLVRQMLKESGLEPDFSAGDLLRIWRKI